MTAEACSGIAERLETTELSETTVAPTLPYELLLSILSILPYPDLATIARASSGLYDLSTTLLYSNLSFSKREEYSAFFSPFVDLLLLPESKASSTKSRVRNTLGKVKTVTLEKVDAPLQFGQPSKALRADFFAAGHFFPNLKLVTLRQVKSTDAELVPYDSQFTQVLPFLSAAQELLVECAGGGDFELLRESYLGFVRWTRLEKAVFKYGMLKYVEYEYGYQGQAHIGLPSTCFNLKEITLISPHPSFASHQEMEELAFREVFTNFPNLEFFKIVCQFAFEKDTLEMQAEDALSYEEREKLQIVVEG